MFVGSGCQDRQPSVYKMFWKRLATQLFDVPSGRMLLVNCNVLPSTITMMYHRSAELQKKTNPFRAKFRRYTSTLAELCITGGSGREPTPGPPHD
jgi:hypothetical protein